MDNKLVDNENPILHKPLTLVDKSKFENDGLEIRPIAALLIEQMYKNNGIGLTASQIGIDMKMFVIDVDSKLRVCINPEIVAAVAELEKDLEGCLSFPGMYLRVNRPTAVIARYLDIDGKEITEQLDGLTARAWLHEYDHTNGICFTDRVSKLSLDMAKRKLAKHQKRSGK